MLSLNETPSDIKDRLHARSKYFFHQKGFRAKFFIAFGHCHRPVRVNTLQVIAFNQHKTAPKFFP